MTQHEGKQLSEAELEAALADLHRHHPSVADKVSQHIAWLTEEQATAFPVIAGEPMVCEKHPWRLWQGRHISPNGNDLEEDCAGPGMPLSAGEYLQRRLTAAEARCKVLEVAHRRIIACFYSGDDAPRRIAQQALSQEAQP